MMYTPYSNFSFEVENYNPTGVFIIAGDNDAYLHPDPLNDKITWESSKTYLRPESYRDLITWFDKQVNVIGTFADFEACGEGALSESAASVYQGYENGFSLATLKYDEGFGPMPSVIKLWDGSNWNLCSLKIKF